MGGSRAATLEAIPANDLPPLRTAMNCQAPVASATTGDFRRGGLAAGVERSPCQPLQGMHGDSGRRDDDAVWPGFRLRQRLPVLGCLDQMAQPGLDGPVEAPLRPPAEKDESEAG